ncbi:MAG: ABC transporter permease [Lachnospiraceae bacterium]|nr:ABC transporter permease [Lachnospiraceae bacterium]
MKRKKKNLNFYIGLVITGIMLLMILVGLFYTPYNPEAMDSTLKNAGVSLAHPFGCDNFGRDILSRVMVGSRTTVLVGLATVVIGTFFGIIIGAFTGYFGGMADEILMRIMDALLAFPSILLALVIIGLFAPSTWNLIMALGIAFVPSFARIVRSEFLRCKNMDYVTAAKLNGAKNLRVMFVHILPNTIKVLSSSVLIGFNNAVLAEAGMSFLGIGVMPPDPSLGRMMSEAQSYIFSNPGFAIFPGIVLILIILGISLIGSYLE